MNKDTTNLTGALAEAMQAAATVASPERWKSICDKLGAEHGYQEVLDKVVAYRLAWEDADPANADEAALAFATLETALRLAAPGSDPSGAVLAAASACLRPWGLPSGEERSEGPETTVAPTFDAPPAARSMAVGGAYTESFAGEAVRDQLRRILHDLVQASGAVVSLLVGARGQLLAASSTPADDIDTSSLASLLADDFTGNLDEARRKPTQLLWRGPTNDGAHHAQIHLIVECAFLVVIYPGSHTGLVAVRARKAVHELEAVLRSIVAGGTLDGRGCGSLAGIALKRITDEDLRDLFG